MKNSKRLLPFLMILMMALSMCTKEKADPTVSDDNNDQQDTTQQQDTADTTTCDTLDHQFADDVKPIFTGNCATGGCHDASTSSNGITLETYTQIKDEIENGNVMCAIRHDVGCTNMPQLEPQLPDSTIQRIQCWIDDGFPND